MQLSAGFGSNFRKPVPAGHPLISALDFRGNSSRCGYKSQVLSSSFWRGLHFCVANGETQIMTSEVVSMVCAAHDFPRISTFWAPENANFSRPQGIFSGSEHNLGLIGGWRHGERDIYCLRGSNFQGNFRNSKISRTPLFTAKSGEQCHKRTTASSSPMARGDGRYAAHGR